jgi:glucan biosynthesis protein C
METKNVQRKYFLDWLRVLAILVVFFYHSGRFFNQYSWHIKNPVTYASVGTMLSYLDTWMMPLIFVVSGASAYLALGKGSAGKFIKDKVLRLLVPVVVAMFSHGALQVYLEHLSTDRFSGSIIDFLPHYFTGIYGIDNGNFALFGMHLWYLVVLFAFSLLCLPLLWWLKRGKGVKVLSKVTNFLAIPGLVILLSLPLILITNLDLEQGVFGWSLGAYLFFYLAGFVIVSNERLLQSIERLRWFWLAVVVVASVVFLSSENMPDTVAWFLTLTSFGFGMKHLNFKTPFLSYANEAVLPFYILHQTVLLSVGFFVTRWSIPDPLKWLVIAAGSFVLVMGLYECVRRVNVLRFLFGMKLLVKEPIAQKQVAALAGESSQS